VIFNEDHIGGRQDPTGPAFTNAIPIFDGLSGSDRLKLLRSLAGRYGHRVLPGLGTFGPQLTAGTPTVGRRPMAVSQPRSTKTAEQKQIDSQIKTLNERIREKSFLEKRRLPLEDPLIQERYQLFRVKREKEGYHRAPLSGARV
jgi:hypothetical protein